MHFYKKKRKYDSPNLKEMKKVRNAMKKIQKSIHPDDAFHYEKMGLKKDEVALWEDGSRVDGSKGCYEWWYYDSHYPDGTVLVIFFFQKCPLTSTVLSSRFLR